MKVWVIMGNDYPHKVFADKEKAEEYLEKKEAVEKEIASRPLHSRERGRIYWRLYDFEVVQ